MFTTVPGNGTFQGVGDEDEVDTVVVSRDGIAGTYSIASNGYGSMTFSNAGLGNVNNLGVYVTDPALNLNDPNNTTSGLGGALIAEMDSLVGTGMVVPQTDTATASFTGTYVFGGQESNDADLFGFGEFDFIGQGSFTNLALNGNGLLSDPYDFFNTPASGTDPGALFNGTAVSDTGHLGRYTIPLQISYAFCTSPTTFSTVIYQASGDQLLWLNTDNDSVFFGFIEQQGSLTGIPAIKKSHAKKGQLKVKPQC
jgi:hypothetical protein